MDFKKIFLGLALSLFVSGQALAEDKINISGSTTVLPVVQSASEIFMKKNPDISIAISADGSGSGLKALAEGFTDIAMSSRKIKEAEVDSASKRGITPLEIKVAIDALIPIVHPDNPVQELSMEQLKAIYSGEIKNWKELGGKNESVVVITRDSSSGTYETWYEVVMKKERISPRAQLQASNGGMAQAVHKNPKAIGYIGFGYLNDNIKAVKLNGVEASTATALDQSWPIARDLFLYTKKEPGGSIKKLIDFLLNPAEGQKIVKEVGYIPIVK